MRLYMQVRLPGEDWETVNTADPSPEGTAELLRLRDGWQNGDYFPPDSQWRVVLGSPSQIGDAIDDGHALGVARMDRPLRPASAGYLHVPGSRRAS